MPAQNHELSQLALQLLELRGIKSVEEILAFVNPAYYAPVDPGVLPGMPQTVRLLMDAVAQGDRICVYGDYDTDGVTSTALLVSLLRLLQAEVEYHVPDRFLEGYGMNAEVIRQLATNGVKLILTCDCGIANLSEVQLAQELGVRVLVTDHHLLPPQLPEADCIINPQMLPEGHAARLLPGVGVAYLLALAVLTQLGKREQAENLLDMVALGMVADVVPLLGENRYLLQIGLERLNSTPRPGLKALIEIAGLRSGAITEEEIAFQLVPRLNAAGRITTAKLAVELLLTQDDREAKQLAGELDQINLQRRQIGEEILQEALSMLDFTYGPRPIVLYRAGWHHGVIGIVAGRLAELYNVPVLLMSLKEDGTTITGSARSIEGVHIFSVLQSCREYLTKFGGHAGAAGFSLELRTVEMFSQAVQHELEQALEGLTAKSNVTYDLTLNLTQATLDTYRDLRYLAPFGAGNPVPKFVSRGIKVISHRAISEQRHLRLVVGQGQVTKQAIWWWGGSQDIPAHADIIYSLGLNCWQGQENLQLIISEISRRKSGLAVQERLVPLEVIDLRNWQEQGNSLPPMAGASFFLEGKQPSFSLPVRNRYNITSTDTLVLLSIPPGLRVLQEVMALSGADKLVLGYGERDALLGQDFLKQLAGMVKFSLKARSGRVYISDLAVATGQLEMTVAAGLQCLQAKGFIKIAYLTPQEISIELGNGTANVDSSAFEVKLKKMLGETRAFRRYMLKGKPTELGKLLTSKASYILQTKES